MFALDKSVTMTETQSISHQTTTNLIKLKPNQLSRFDFHMLHNILQLDDNSGKFFIS